MPEIYSLASQKGGVGKTSCTLALATGLAQKGKRVLLIDVDPQANSSKVLLADYMADIKPNDTLYNTIIKRGPLPLHKTQYENLTIVPSHIFLSDTDLELANALDNRAARLKNQLDQIKDNYDYIFLDCPPSLGLLTINAFTASDYVLVVTSYGYFELDSTIQISRVINQVKEEYKLNTKLTIKGFIFNLADHTANSRETLALLKDRYQGFVFETQIPRNIAVKNSAFNKTDIYSYDKASPAAIAFTRLMQEIFNV